jgi:hypothetical protein
VLKPAEQNVAPSQMRDGARRPNFFCVEAARVQPKRLPSLTIPTHEAAASNQSNNEGEDCMRALRRLLTISLLAACAVGVATVHAADANVTGTWNMTVEVQGTTGNPTFTLKQQGTEVSGTYKGSMGEAPVTGTVNGNEITLKYKGSTQGVELDVTYAGTVEGDTMKGKINFGGMAEGTFSGKKG